MFGWVTPFWYWLGNYTPPEPSTQFACCGRVVIYRVGGYVTTEPGAVGSVTVRPGASGQSYAGCQCCDE